MIYYPIPLYKQKAFYKYVEEGFMLTNTESLSDQVISLPIHTEMTEQQQAIIIEKIAAFF
jgi:dTDP-4-amino-4,6-dideoxygalactose transaminase